jgi:hypothetical protein
MTYRMDCCPHGTGYVGSGYWKSMMTMIMILILIIGMQCSTTHRSGVPHIRWVSSNEHSDCGTMDHVVVSDTARDESEETTMFGRPIR